MRNRRTSSKKSIEDASISALQRMSALLQTSQTAAEALRVEGLNLRNTVMQTTREMCMAYGDISALEDFVAKMRDEQKTASSRLMFEGLLARVCSIRESNLSSLTALTRAVSPSAAFDLRPAAAPAAAAAQTPRS